MNAQPDPAGELTARVVLGTSRLVLKVPGERAVSFDEETLSRLFRAGLSLGRGADWGTVPLGELRAKGDVAFLVGRVDVGMDVGLRALADGLVRAVATAVDLDRPWNATRPNADDPQPAPVPPVDDSIATYRAALGRLPEWPPVTLVAVDDLQANFDAWLARVEQGTALTLTRDGRPVAALVRWEWFRGQRERLARIEAAYWMAWVGGRFDPVRFVDLVDELVTPPGELSTKPLLDDEGDGDVDAG